MVAKWVAKWVVEKAVALAGSMGVMSVARWGATQVVDSVDGMVVGLAAWMAEKKAG